MHVLAQVLCGVALVAALVLVVTASTLARSEGRRLATAAAACGVESYLEVGGARLDTFNATSPFVTLVATPQELVLCFMRHVHRFPVGEVRRLARYRGLFSTGLDIDHTVSSLPTWVIFWTADFERTARALENFGWRITRS